MGHDHWLPADGRARLERLLMEGLSDDAVQHARQVAGVAGILSEAFEAHGFSVTVVGGSAIELHAPGIYMSGDIDVVIEKSRVTASERDQVFIELGLERIGRHWRYGDLFVETVPGPVAGPTDVVEMGTGVFRVVRKEVPLRDRVVVTHRRLLALIDDLHQREGFGGPRRGEGPSHGGGGTP